MIGGACVEVVVCVEVGAFSYGDVNGPADAGIQNIADDVDNGNGNMITWNALKCPYSTNSCEGG